MLGEFLPHKMQEKNKNLGVILENVKPQHIKQLLEMENPPECIIEMANAFMVIINMNQNYDNFKSTISDPSYKYKLY